MKKVTFTRLELYDLVWKQTMKIITKQYGISSAGLRKACKDMQIPLPDAGHWVRIRYNKPLYKDKLSQNYEGLNSIEIIKKKYEVNTIPATKISPLLELIKLIESDKKAPVVVPEIITKPDILIQNTKLIHDKRKSNGHKLDDKTDTVNISVEEANYSRALRIMDSFVKLLRYRGHTFRRDINNRGPRIVVNDVEFHFSLREMTKRIPPKKPYGFTEYLHTGVLVMKIGESYHAKEWKDGFLMLEKQLTRIVAKIELSAQEELEFREESRLRDLKRAEEEKVKNEFLQRKNYELSLTRDLVFRADNFNKVSRLRKYISAVEENAVKENKLTQELKDWIKWAEDKSDWLDPLINRQDEILRDEDKDNIGS
jgi:hypothetical protein